MRNVIESFNKNKESYISGFRQVASEAEGTAYIYPLKKFQNTTKAKTDAYSKVDISAIEFNTMGIVVEAHPLPNIPIFGSIAYTNYLNSSYKEDNKFETLFWTIVKNCNHFEHLSKFDAFMDVIVTIPESVKLKKRGQLFNTQGWLRYLDELIKFFYPEFIPLSIQNSSRRRFEKIVNNDFRLFIEYNESDFKQNLNKGRLVLPNITYGFHLTNNNTDTIIGELKDPLVGEAAIPLESYYANKTMEEVELGVFEITNQIITELLTDGRVRLYNSQEFGSSLIKHLFFYLDMNRFYFSNYSKFWESILEDA